MKFFRDYFPVDVIIALLVLLAAGTASAFIFERISLQRKDKTAMLTGLEAGERTYRLRSQNGCVGSFNLNLKVSREESSLMITGLIKLAAGQNIFTPSVSGEISFNNLGQLGGSVFRITAEGMQVVVGTTGLRKMHLVFKSTIGNSVNRFDIPVVAGPFTLVREKDGKYQISGPLPESMKTFQPGAAFASLISSYPMQIEEGAGACPADGMTPVDLNPVINRFGSMFHL